jgi:hypothetical protein
MSEPRADNRRWRVEVTSDASLKRNVDDAVLVIRLGLAVTAIRSAQRFYIATSEVPGPGGERDTLWAFLLATAYLHETRAMLQPQFPRVRELAVKGGVTEAHAAEVGALLSGRKPLGRALERIRNELVFHFDAKAVRRWVDGYSEASVVWAEGIGPKTGDVLYRASTDAIVAALVRERAPGKTEQQELRDLLSELLPATQAITEFLERAIAGYLDESGATGSYLS